MATLNTNTLSTLTALAATFYDKKALSVLRPNLKFQELTMAKNIPQNSGNVVQFFRYTRVPGVTTAVTEGTVKNGTALTTSTVTAQLASYYDYTVMSDLIDLLGIDDAVESAVTEMAKMGADTYDLLIREAITAGATNHFANGNTALTQIGVDDIMKMVELRKVNRKLKAANVPEFSDGWYRILIHPHQEYDLKALTTVGEFNDIHKYTNNEPLLRGEVGRAEGFKIMVSTNVKTTTTGTSASATAYYAAASGDMSTATIGVGKGAGKPYTFISKPGEGGVFDPGRQYWTIVFKIDALAVKVLEAARIYNVITGATQIA